MIKKLRRKLVLISMMSLLLVLLIIEGSVGFLNYHKIATDADKILQILEQNDGRFPKTNLVEEAGDVGVDKETDLSGKRKQILRKPDGKNGIMSKEMPYESRFFSVVLKTNGETVVVDTGKVASIDTSTAMEYAQAVWNSGKQKGFMEEYRYLVCKTEEDSEVRIIFLDRERELSNFQNLLTTGVAVTILGLCAVFVLIWIFSAYIIKPFVENYEKQKRFITDAGHELKTPLTIIDADAEVLEMDLGENEWISDIQSQTRRLADLTNDLILLSRMEENREKNHGGISIF